LLNINNTTKTQDNVRINHNQRGTTVTITDGMKKYYMDLCFKKGLVPQDVSNIEYENFQKLLSQVKEFYPASNKQKEKIKSLTEELGIKYIKIGEKTTEINESFINRLRGGTEGSASKLLNHLFKIEREARKDLSPTEGQEKMLIDMFICPDVNFREIGISTCIELEDETNLTTVLLYNDPHARDFQSFLTHNRDVIVDKEWYGQSTKRKDEYCLGYIEVKIATKRLHRMITQEEFKEQLKENVSREVASQFIEKYKNAYYGWNKTRASDRQINFINQLQKRLADLYTPKPIQEKARLVGDELIMMDIESSSHASYDTDQTNNDYEVQSYSVLDKVSLKQLDVEGATKLIQQIQWEISQKKQYSFGEREDASDTLEELRTAKDQNEKQVAEFTALSNLVHNLHATIGLRADEDILATARPIAESFRAEWEERDENGKYVQLHKGGFHLDKVEERHIKTLQEFLYMLIDEGEFKEAGLMSIIEESGSETANRILLGRY
jgi:hypothetical protein